MASCVITLGTFYGFVYGFKDAERSKSAIRLNDLFLEPAMQALGDKVFGDLWDLVTNANFASKSTITAANFDRNDLADLGAILSGSTIGAPKTGRTVWSAPTWHAGLVKSLNGAEFPGQMTEKAEGNAIRTAGFNCFETNLADDNSENLGAFAFHRSALLIAGRRVDSEGAAEAGVEVQDIVVPGLEIPIQFRRWYDANAGELKYSVGLLYGVKKGTSMGTRVLSA